MAIFGSRASRPVHWLNTGLVEARRVGRIHGERVRAIATGFLIDGGLINDELQSLPLFVTCNHCVSGAARRDPNSIPWSDGAVVFQQMQTDPSVKGETAFLQSLSDSPVNELNYTRLLLDRWPGAVTDLKVAPRKPQLNDKVFVISYPRGEGLAVSLDDNVVVAATQTDPQFVSRAKSLIFYRAPTEPGSSGAPVFNEHWEIVAMHIGRGEDANYGVAMDRVVEDARSNLKGLSIPQKIRDLVHQPDDTSPKALQDAANYFSVFISYRHEDAAFARRIFNAFESRGVRAWLDEKQMVPGQFIDEAIQKGILASDRFVLCCSKASLENSWWVDSEMGQIFEKERELSQTAGRKLSVVIPVMLDDYLKDGWRGAKAAELRSRYATDFRGWQDEKAFEQAFETLLRAIRTATP
jgi:hypothetical protein